jgi:anaerobic dimethyl sulfoxide reductase subunit B
VSPVSQYAFYFDSGACSGCKTCQLACKDKNNLGPGVLWRRVYEIAGGGWRREGALWLPGVYAYNISLGCNHCADPACLKSCPTKAITKEPDGIVLLDSRRCIGCRYCEWSCPYGAPRYDPGRGVVSKCDFCFDLIDSGGTPACVAACPTRALEFGELEDLRAKHGGRDDVFPLPIASQTRPSLLIRAHRDAARAGAGEAGVANDEEV